MPGTKEIDLKYTRRKKFAANVQVTCDKLPPHSEEAEQGILGCIMLDAACLDSCLEKFHAKHGEVFYDIRHQSIFDAMVAIKQSGKVLDLITLHQRLKDNNQIEEVGGFSYVASLPEAVPSAANLPNYLDIVWEKYLLRSFLETASNQIGNVYENEGNVLDLLNESSRAVSEIAELCAISAGSESNSQDCIVSLGEILDERMKHRGMLPGLPTGFVDLDYKILGLQKKQLYIFGARPSQGKTALMCNMVQHLSIDRGIPTLVFSLEMPRERVALRICCAMCKVDTVKAMCGSISDKERTALAGAMAKFAKSPVHIIDTSTLTPRQIHAATRSYIRKHGIQAVFVDYAQRIQPDKSHEKKTYEIGDISCAMQAMAKELNIPVVLLAQLKREFDDKNNPGKKKRVLPTMSDLGDSGMLERDADAIILMARHPDQNLNDEVWQYKFNIDKARDAIVGTIDVVFFKRWTKFESCGRNTVDNG